MSFKNAFKLLLSKFSYVWSILLYVAIMLVVLVSLGLTFILPVYHALTSAGVGVMLNSTIASFLDGASLSSVFESVKEIWFAVKKVFETQPSTAYNTALFVVLVLTVAYRFILGLYEIPIVAVIQGFMSDNARYGYTSKFVAHFGKSIAFSFVKMIFMIIFDTVIHLIVYGIILLVSPVSVLLVPIAVMFVYLVLLSFRYSIIATWSPSIVVEGKGIYSGFVYSVKFAFKHFKSVYFIFLVVWVLIISFCSFIGVFTFFVGLIVAIPISMFFINLINMTIYYGRTNKSYYLDGEIFKPDKK